MLAIRRLFPASFGIVFLILLELLIGEGSFSSEVLAQTLPTVTTAPTPSPIPHAVSWRLPFDGAAHISNGPGEGLHVLSIGGNDSREAIDFAPTVDASFPILAPIDGTVFDYRFVNDFGNVLRIYHESTKTCSFVTAHDFFES